MVNAFESFGQLISRSPDRRELVTTHTILLYNTYYYITSVVLRTIIRRRALEIFASVNREGKS